MTVTQTSVVVEALLEELLRITSCFLLGYPTWKREGDFRQAQIRPVTSGLECK